jgi:hypothetical protein
VTQPSAIAIAGASGLIGAALVERLIADGHHILRLVRRPSADQSEIQWDPEAGTIDAGALEGIDAVVNLAGESIAEGRWNDAKRQRIRRSRVVGTRLLAETLAGLNRPPRVFVACSAVGIYGDRGDEVLTEDSDTGEGFLADVGREWEAAADPARAAGIRVVHPRVSLVLTLKGGALKKMLPPFRLGVAGPLGSGRQWMTWITLDDAVAALIRLIEDDTFAGPVNLAAPEPVTNRAFTKALGRVLHRPTIFPAPAFALRLLLGDMADEALLASVRAEPRRLTETSFEFRHATLESALRTMLGNH